MSNQITFRNVRIIYRNFSGRPTDYTPEGRRTFSVVIEDEQLAENLRNDGWNVKTLKPRDENDPPRWHLPVAVYFGVYPPQITMISGNSKVLLTEETVNILDWSEIVKVDLIVRPNNYTIAGRSGIKAYLKSLYVTVQPDELAEEYADIGVSNEDDAPF